MKLKMKPSKNKKQNQYDASEKKIWSSLNHRVYQTLRQLHSVDFWKDQSILVALSGGLDSVVLLDCLLRVQNKLKYSVGVIHIHHGPSESKKLQKFRDQAFAFAKKMAQEKRLEFLVKKSRKKLLSEEEMRNFRKESVYQFQKKYDYRFTAWAHHQEDFLETQFLRLIRGTGKLGLEPMLLERNQELRPFLQISKVELAEYAQKHNLEFLLDPSNQDSKYLRNWLRNEWLPMLEDKCPGALKSFSRSLSLILEDEQQAADHDFLDQSLSKSSYLSLSVAQKKQLLARYLRFRGQKHFNHNQIEEIMKRLDNPKNVHSFTVAQMLWKVSRDSVFAEPASLVNDK